MGPQGILSMLLNLHIKTTCKDHILLLKRVFFIYKLHCTYTINLAKYSHTENVTRVYTHGAVDPLIGAPLLPSNSVQIDDSLDRRSQGLNPGLLPSKQNPYPLGRKSIKCIQGTFCKYLHASSF